MEKIVVFFLLLNPLSNCLAFGNENFLSKGRRRTPVNVFAKGDPLREATGVRPSLHPTTINAIAEALKLRASGNKDYSLSVADGDKPLDVVVSAGKIATQAIAKRMDTSKEDGMAFTEKECQTIVGRVVGVAVRFGQLEELLVGQVASVSWVKKYNEWSSFGVLEDEGGVRDRIRDDPLFTLSRAECLLALFLNTIEGPTLEGTEETVPGGSEVDFIDADRAEVLSGF